MTEREQQILSWIQQNPMISQQELADLAGITRSGVAAHISNLIRKGYLRGKGYIVTPPSYVTVIGGISMDVLGIACGDLMDYTSNAAKALRAWRSWAKYRSCFREDEHARKSGLCVRRRP